MFFCLYLLLAFLLYQQESRVLATIASKTNPSLLKTIQDNLLTRKLPFLPGMAWRLALPLAIVGMGLLLPFRWRWPLYGLSGLLLSLLLLADRAYFDFFAAITSLDSLRAAHQLWDVRASLWTIFRAGDLLVLAIYTAFGCIGFFAERLRLVRPPGRQAFWMDKIAAVLFFALAFHCARVAFFFPTQQLRIRTGQEKGRTTAGGGAFVPTFYSSQKEFATYFGLYSFHMYDAWSTLKSAFQKPEVSPENLRVIDFLLSEKKQLNDRDSPFRGIAHGRNLVLISLESFQYFLLGLKVEGREVTPTLNGLAQQALRWDYIFDNVGRGGTSDAEFMVMSGLLPDTRRMASMSVPARNTLLALPAQLKRGGYHTYSLHGNDPSFWNRHTNHPIYGIDRMIFKSDFPPQRLGMGVPDHVFFPACAEYIAGMERPFLAYMIALSSHHPYAEVPESFRDWNTGLPKKIMATRYLQLARYSDESLAVFVEKMKANGLWKSSVFVIYGDHISPLDSESRDRVRQKLAIDLNSDRALRIPFLILIPGEEAFIEARRDSIVLHVGGLQDLFPSVLHLLGLEIPYGLYGTHLFLSNQEKGPLPYPRLPGTFIDRGILYSQGGRITDKRGLVFMPHYDLPKLSQTQIRANINKIEAEVELHRLIFDADAQIKAIRLHQASLLE